MAIHLEHIGHALYADVDDPADHVAWPLDDLPRLAADIHRTVARLLVCGVTPTVIDDFIVDLLCGATPDAAPMPTAG